MTLIRIVKSCCMDLEFRSLNTLRLLPGGEEGDLGFPIELEFRKKHFMSE